MWKQVMLAAGTDEFPDLFEEALSQQNLNVNEFAEKYDLSKSTLYKITSGERTDFRVQTLRNIVDSIRAEEGYGRPVIGLITTRYACDRAPSEISVDGATYEIKPLPAQSIEDEIIKGVNAERDGIDAILCGPIAATTLEQVVNVPVGGLQFDETLMVESLQSLIHRLG